MVTIYDVGEADGRPFIVMEYLPGGSLADRLAAGRPSTAAGARLDRRGGARAGRGSRGAGSSTGTSSRRTCSSTAPGTSTSPTSGSRAPPGSTRYTQTGDCARNGRLSRARAGRAASGRRRRATCYALAVVAAELLGPDAPAAAIDRGLAHDPAERYASAGELAAALRAAHAGGEPPTVVIGAPGRGDRTGLRWRWRPGCSPSPAWRRRS